ncbi:unnamed protein product [Paramecium sonneborni]|uniref:Transmembrane protein n=1 Tax=Paramecium sonneborni TaxID=65129 RepID=A0A8S1RVF7_9CILI|nr:unnamed protein product [Paramecium sonneborni]
MSYFLQSIDQFGAQQKLQIPPINPTQKSAFGGLVTLALYGISLGYFLFQFVDWQQNNKLPKVTSLQDQIGENQQLNIKGVFAEIIYIKELKNQIDPFDPENLILQPFLISFTNSYSNATIINATFSKNTTQNGQIFNTLFLQDIVLQNTPINSIHNYYTNYELSIGYCNQEQLQDGQKCANQDLVDKFFLQDNEFQLLIYFEQFDQRNKKIIKVPRIFIFDIIQNQIFYNQFVLKVGELTLDDGFLFPNSNKLTYLSDVTILSTQYDQEFSKKVFGKELISLLYFNLDQIKIVNMVEYPKISEILADTGSIITWILSISFIVSKYNENICLQKTQNEVIQMYYHDFIDFKIQKNWLGKVIKVNYKEKEYDPKKSEEILSRLNQIVIEKMNYLNLQNEVAKLQLILQEHLGLQQIKKYLDSKSKLELLFEKLCIHEKTPKQQINQIHILNEQQFGRVSYSIGESEIRAIYNISLDQEIEEKIGLLSIKIVDNSQNEKPNSNQDIIQPLNNFSAQFQVINIEQSVDTR